MAAPTYFGSASIPTPDSATATNATATLTITPPGSMLTGDLVVVYCLSRLSATWTNGVTGGQSWTADTAFAGASNPFCRIFWCTFNGTWGANPRFDSTSSTNTTAVMHVFRPDGTTKVWAIDVAQASTQFTAPSTPFTVTRTGLTTVNADTITLATWGTADDNTWGTLTGTGWVVSGSAQYRNIASTDSSCTFAHHLDAGPAAVVPDAAKNQATNGGDAGVTSITAWYAAAAPSSFPAHYYNQQRAA